MPTVGVGVAVVRVGRGVGEMLTVGVVGTGVCPTGVGKGPPEPAGTVGVTPFKGRVGIGVALFPMGAGDKIIWITTERLLSVS
jgi:hypothetical protein